jgi:hypothetical protein
MSESKTPTIAVGDTVNIVTTMNYDPNARYIVLHIQNQRCTLKRTTGSKLTCSVELSAVQKIT